VGISQTFDDIDEDKLSEIRILDTFVHFAAKQFRWSVPDIRETLDVDFFNCVLIEERSLEDEKKEYEKANRRSGHSGGGSMPRAGSSNSKPVDIGEDNAPPEDRGMVEMFNRLRGDSDD